MSEFDLSTVKETEKLKVGFTQHQFLLGEHICSFYEDFDERMDIVLPYVRSCLQAGHKCLGIFNKDDADIIQKKLIAKGLKIEEHLISGQLLLLTQEDFHLGQDGFDPDKLIGIFHSTIERALEDKWKAVRIIVEWSFILKNFKDIKMWSEMEARFNYEFNDLPVILLCLWDQNTFNGDFLINLIKTHPFVTMGGDIYVNPFYIEPADFIDSFKKKHYV